MIRALAINRLNKCVIAGKTFSTKGLVQRSEEDFYQWAGIES